MQYEIIHYCLFGLIKNYLDVLESSIQVEQGLFVSAVHCGDLIGKDGLLPSVGDRLISVSFHCLEQFFLIIIIIYIRCNKVFLFFS